MKKIFIPLLVVLLLSVLVWIPSGQALYATDTVFQLGTFDDSHDEPASDGFSPGPATTIWPVDLSDLSTFPGGMIAPGGGASIPFSGDLLGGSILTISWSPGHSAIEQFEVVLDDLPAQYSRAIQGSPSTLYYPDGRWGWTAPGRTAPFPYYTEVFLFGPVDGEEHTLLIHAISGDGFGVDAVLLLRTYSGPAEKTKLGSYHWRDDVSTGSAGVKYWYEDVDGDDLADYLYLEFHVTYFATEEDDPGWLGYFIVDPGFTSDGAYDSFEEGDYKVMNAWGKIFLKGPYKGPDTYFDLGVNEPFSGFLWHGDCWGEAARANQAFVFADINGAHRVQKGMKLLFTAIIQVPATFHTSIGYHVRMGYPATTLGNFIGSI